MLQVGTLVYSPRQETKVLDVCARPWRDSEVSELDVNTVFLHRLSSVKEQRIPFGSQVDRSRETSLQDRLRPGAERARYTWKYWWHRDGIG